MFKGLEWPPVPEHDFGNAIIITKDGKIILSRSEDRIEFTPYGGEIDWRNGEQSNEAAAREIEEETGKKVKPKPEELILLDTVKVFPVGEESDGIIKSVDTYVYFMKETDEMPSVDHQEHEEGCRIEEIILTSFPEIWQLIEQGELKVFSNFIGTLVKLEAFLENK